MEAKIPSNRKCRRPVGHRPTPKVPQVPPPCERGHINLPERSARRHFRRLMHSAGDEMVRVAVKTSLSGVAALALYWWNHHH
jgi:hypothetical protein